MNVFLQAAAAASSASNGAAEQANGIPAGAAWFSLISFVVGALFAATEILLVKYPRTWRMAWCGSLVGYAAVYGVVGLIVYFATGIEGFPGAGHPLPRAIIIGVLARGLGKLNLFIVPIGDRNVEVGTSLLTSLVEKKLLQDIALREHRTLKDWVKQYVAKPTIAALSLPDLAKKALTTLPATFDPDDKAKFSLVLQAAPDAEGVLMSVVQTIGIDNAKQAFDSW